MIDVSTEIKFKTARSGGSGGQNVNKVETMVEGRFSIANSELLNNEQKELIILKIGKKLLADDILLVKSQEDRTQLGNKEIVKNKINDILRKSLIVPKKRKPTKVPKQVIEKRLNSKKKIGEIKVSRKKIINE